MPDVRILKKIDGVLGPLILRVVAMLFRPRRQTTHNINTCLFIRPGGIGDAVLLVPAFKALRIKFPRAAIHVLSEKRNSAVFALYPDIQRICHYDLPLELLAAVRGDYDVVIDTEQWHRLSAVITGLTRAPVSIGYETNERKKLFTHCVPYSHEDYEVDSFLNLIVPIVGEASVASDAPFLTVPESAAVTILPQIKPIENRSIISIFPGGSIRERQWGSGRFYKTAKLLCEKGYGIVVVGGKDDIRAGEAIVSGLSGALNLCGKLSLPETAAVLQKSDLLITGDSGIMHIGSGLGIKVLALFGPGREKKWAPQGKNCKVINRHLPCSPCTTFGYTPKCRNNAACMSAITVEEVVREALALLNA